MKKPVLTAFAFLLSLGVITDRAKAVESAVLAEMYGRGVHAYYAGDYTNATRYLSMAIDNGSEDPRAFYFRGIVANSSGHSYEAEADWQRGAELEAAGRANPAIGRALARFQGSARIKLEEMRQNARLQALALSGARSQQRYDEIEAAEPNVLRTPPRPPAGAAPSAAPPAAAAPAAPPAGAENPFADDMAAGDPTVTADDALEGAMADPFADDAAPAGAAPAAGGDSNPFADPGGGDDPFGGGDSSDPFGGDSGGGMDDPFGGGGDPFGN